MTTIELLTQQLKDAHQVFLGTLEGITDDQANFQPEGKALSVGATWIHHVEGEDTFLSAISGQPTLESGEFKDKTGFSQPQPMADWAETYPKWSHEVKATVTKLLDYNKAVFTASEKYVASLSPEDLDRKCDMGHMGEATVQTVVSSYIIAHCNQIAGEISAVKGIQGLKGYPW